jgi:hypothetical protein
MGDNFLYLAPMEGTTLVTQRLSSSEVRTRIGRNSRTPPPPVVVEGPGGMARQHSVQSDENAYGVSEKAAIQEGNFQMVEGLVPPSVLAHIIRNKLYV